MVDFDKIKKNAGIFGKKASTAAVIGVANGAYHVGKRALVVGKETIKLAQAVHNKDAAKQKESAEKIVDETVVKTAQGIASVGKQLGKTAIDAKDYILEKNPILKDKKLHSTIIGGAALTGTLAAGVLVGDMIADNIVEAAPDLSPVDMAPVSVFLPEIDVNSIYGIHNYVVSDTADINALSDLGMKPELIDNHIDSSLIDRSETAKMDFLHAIGHDSLPKGYEVHHVVPLSQGGLDIPENMVLISEQAHDIITNQHRNFYGW